MNKNSPEQENLVSLERKKSHHLFIGIHGEVAAGKTELAKLLAERFGLVLVEEKYSFNPYLEDFYSDPQKWSFFSQSFFFERKVRNLVEMPRDKPVVLAPDLWQDRDIYAYVHRQMGWMTNGDYQTYLFNCDRSLQFHQLPCPDLIISVQAPFRVILERIRRRAETEDRGFELQMLENKPDYFFQLSQRVVEWADENPYQLPIIKVDSHQFDYRGQDRDLVASQIQEEVLYQLRKKSDLILPESLRPKSRVSSRAGRFSKMDNQLRRT